MKKYLNLFMLAILMFTLTLNSQAGIFDFLKKEKKDDSVELRFFWWGNDSRHQATLNMIHNFENENPNIDVKAEYIGYGSLEEKFSVQMIGDTEADIMQIDQDWLYKYSSDGKGYYDLRKIKSLDLSTYNEEFLKAGEINGVQNAVPLGRQVVALVINKSQYERVGVNKIPTTWDEFKVAAKKFPEGSYPIVAPSRRFAIIIYLQQKTGLPEFAPDGSMNWSLAQYTEALNWYQDMVNAGVICSRQDYLENVGPNPVSLAQNKKFINGEYAGVLEWVTGAVALEATLKEKGDQIDIIPIPLVDGAKDINTIGKTTFLFAIKDDEKNPEEAGKFLNEFLNGKKSNEILGTVRGIPESHAAVEALKGINAVSGIAEKALEYTKNVKSINVFAFAGAGSLQSIAGEAMENMELGRMSVEEAAKDYYAKTKKEAEKLSKAYKLK